MGINSAFKGLTPRGLVEVRGEHKKYDFKDGRPLHLDEMGDQVLLWSLTLTPVPPPPKQEQQDELIVNKYKNFPSC